MINNIELDFLTEKDITIDWIKNNIDLNKNRKTSQCYNTITIYNLTEDAHPEIESNTIDEVFEIVKKKAHNNLPIIMETFYKDNNITVNDVIEQKFVLRQVGDYDSSETRLDLIIKFIYTETIDEAARRVQQKFKTEIRKERIKNKNIEKILNDEKSERELFEKLKKKFEG